MTAAGTSIPMRLLREIASPISSVYERAAVRRRASYRERPERQRRLARPVVSIGNLTVGGTGKTPMTILLARELSARGFVVSVLSRGYGGKRDHDPMSVEGAPGEWRYVGDEPALIARESGARVTVGHRRYEAGLLAESADPRIDLHLLDDGFQHLDLARQLDVVMVSTEAPLAEARCLPSGPFREPPGALASADVVVVRSSGGRIPDEWRAAIRARTSAAQHGASLVLRSLSPAGVAGETREPAWLAGRKVAAFAGIARPDAFASDLTAAGASVVELTSFPDHAPIPVDELLRMARRARDRGAEALLCTAKDAVRIAAPEGTPVPLYVARAELVVEDIAGIVDRIASLMPRRP